MVTKIISSERKSLWAFLILTPLISLAIPIFLPLSMEMVPLTMVFVPALLAVILTAFTQGSKGVGALLKRLYQWRVGLKWYFIALGMAFGIRLAISTLAYLLGWVPTLQLNEWSTQAYVIFAAFTLVGAVMEELGWRGFALPRLLSHRPALLSALIIALPWGIVHLGLVLPGQMNAGTSWVGTLLSLTGFSVVLTWLFVQTRGSLVIVVLFHAAQNYFVFLNGGIDAAGGLWLYTTVTLALALVLALLNGANLQRRSVKTPAAVETGWLEPE
jgi:membrane protease YdiL (CAAX protease family)